MSSPPSTRATVLLRSTGPAWGPNWEPNPDISVGRFTSVLLLDKFRQTALLLKIAASRFWSREMESWSSSVFGKRRAGLNLLSSLPGSFLSTRRL